MFVWLSTHYGVGEEWGIGPIDDAVTPAEVALFGRDLAVPLAARQYAGPAAAGPTGLRIEPAGALLAEVRPVAGGVRVRLHNPGDRPVPATVAWAGRLNPVTVPAQAIADVVMLTSPGKCG